MKRLSLGFTLLALVAIAGCPATADDLCAKGTCEPASGTSAAPADAGPDGIVVAPRDPCVETPLATECLDDKSALFVSKTADPNGADGSIAHPYPSIRTALEKTTDAKKRVYVCEGTYEEQVSIERIPATLIGGVACDFKGPGGKPRIAPPSGIALAIAAVGGASVRDVAVQASSEPNKKGSSAIAMFVTGAQDSKLAVAALKAGAFDFVVKDATGEFLLPRVGEGRVVDEGDLVTRRGQSIPYLGAAVADADDARACRCIEIAAAGRILQIGAFTPDDGWRDCVEIAIEDGRMIMHVRTTPGLDDLAKRCARSVRAE